MPLIDVPGLVSKVRSGDKEALDALTEHFRPHVLDYLTRQDYRPRYDPGQEAEDLTQQTFLKLPAALARYEEQDKFPAFLRRVAFNQYRSRHRRRGGPKGGQPEGASPGKVWRRKDPETRIGTLAAFAAPATWQRTAKMDLPGIIARLKEGDREILQLWAKGATHAEIADFYGISIPASQVRLHRAKKALKDMWASLV